MTKDDIEDLISDAVGRLLYYDRKEDDEFGAEAIGKALRKGNFTVDDMVRCFERCLRDGRDSGELAPRQSSGECFGSHRTGRCRAGGDGECCWSECPQLRDGEPDRSGRHCPLDDSNR